MLEKKNKEEIETVLVQCPKCGICDMSCDNCDFCGTDVAEPGEIDEEDIPEGYEVAQATD